MSPMQQQQWAPPATPSSQPPSSPLGNAPAGLTRFPVPGQPAYAPSPDAQFVRYANLGARFLALLIDGVILGAIQGGLIALLYAFAIVSGYLVGDGVGAFVLGAGAWIVTPALCLGVSTIYFLRGETSMDQATIGKRAMGLRVVNQYGGTLTAGQSVGRFVCRIFSGSFFCLGYVLALFNDRRQTLHDMVVGSVVLER